MGDYVQKGFAYVVKDKSDRKGKRREGTEKTYVDENPWHQYVPPLLPPLF